MSAFDITGPSSIGKDLEKAAQHRRNTASASNKRREAAPDDPGTEIFNGASKIYRKSYAEMRMKK